MNCLILHGTGGHDKENWFPWLKKELNEIGIKTEVPNFPDSDKPILEDWLRKLEEYNIAEDTILIGHSLGCPLILRLLEKGKKIKAAYLVAAFMDDLGWDVLEESNFFSKPFDLGKIKKNCKHFEVFTSKNDPYLKIKHGQEVADNLNVKNQVLDVYKHLYGILILA